MVTMLELEVGIIFLCMLHVLGPRLFVFVLHHIVTPPCIPMVHLGFFSMHPHHPAPQSSHYGHGHGHVRECSMSSSLLVTGTEDADSDMTSFLSAMTQAEVDSIGFLSLPLSMSFPGALISKLYVRPVYKELFDLIWNLPRVLVTGTPGTGKSILIWWLMYSALKAQPELVIIWESISDPGVRIMFKAGQGFIGSRISFQKEMNDERTWQVNRFFSRCFMPYFPNVRMGSGTCATAVAPPLSVQRQLWSLPQNVVCTR